MHWPDLEGPGGSARARFRGSFTLERPRPMVAPACFPMGHPGDPTPSRTHPHTRDHPRFAMSAPRLGASGVTLGVLCVAALLASCQGVPDATSPEFAQSKLPRVLTVTGLTPAITCSITSGSAATAGC